jgi:hypothetical protein
MSLINSQVRFGRPLLADPLPFQDPRYRRMGRVENLGVVAPAGPPVKIEEVGGLLGGTGLLIGSGFVKAPAAIIMAILGALGVAISGYSILSRMMSAPSTAVPTGTMPPAPPAKPGTVQTATSMVQTYAPVVQALVPAIKNLFSTTPTPKPATTSSSSPAMVTSYSQLQTPPVSRPAPAAEPVFVTSLDTPSSSSDEYGD